MAGKITGNEHKKFSKKYQPPEKWTEEAALKVGHDLIKWMKEKDEDGEDKGNTLFDEFLYIENDFYPNLISYLTKKFQSFCELIKIAKKIQETKLHKYGLADRFNTQITKFSLINNHGWKDKKEIEETRETTVKISDKQVKEINEKLDELY